jgi:predicted GIY-YIG superfamily endonuclease
LRRRRLRCMEAGGERHFIYSLPLQSDRWYVGITCSPPARLAEHRRGEGAEWTRLYPPTSGFARVKLASGDKVQARIEEDAEVKRLMRLHGIGNVRGGSYTRVQLSRADVKAISKELNHAGGGCLRCGHRSHWVSQCYAQRDVEGRSISSDEEGDARAPRTPPHSQEGEACGGCAAQPRRFLPRRFPRSQGGQAWGDSAALLGSLMPRRLFPATGEHSNEEFRGCHRCGRTSHRQHECFARTDLHGCVIEGASQDSARSGQGSQNEDAMIISSDDDADEEGRGGARLGLGGPAWCDRAGAAGKDAAPPPLPTVAPTRVPTVHSLPRTPCSLLPMRPARTLDLPMLCSHARQRRGAVPALRHAVKRNLPREDPRARGAAGQRRLSVHNQKY